MEKCRNGTLNLPKNMGCNARELVKQLLTDDPVARLEIEDIKKHNFFKNVNWSHIRHRKIQPPFVPDMSHLLYYNNVDFMDEQDRLLSLEEMDSKNKMKPSSMKKDNDRSMEKGEKLERIPELPTELNVNISPQVRDADQSQKKAMKFDRNNLSSRNSDERAESNLDNRDQLEEASRAQANSRNRHIDRE